MVQFSAENCFSAKISQRMLSRWCRPAVGGLPAATTGAATPTVPVVPSQPDRAAAVPQVQAKAPRSISAVVAPVVAPQKARISVEDEMKGLVERVRAATAAGLVRPGAGKATQLRARSVQFDNGGKSTTQAQYMTHVRRISRVQDGGEPLLPTPEDYCLFLALCSCRTHACSTCHTCHTCLRNNPTRAQQHHHHHHHHHQ